MKNVQCVGKLRSSNRVLILAELNHKTYMYVSDNSQEIPDWTQADMDKIKDSLHIDWKDTFNC